MSDQLRARVLYYYAVSRKGERVHLGNGSLARLLDFGEGAAALDRVALARALALLPPEGPVRYEADLKGVQIWAETPQTRTIRSAEVEEVFNAWAEATGHTRAKLDSKRKNVIIARLRDGFTVEQLKRACVGVTRSPWHQGENERRTVYDDLALVLRDAGQVERFEALADAKPLPPSAPKVSRVDRAAEATEERRGSRRRRE